MLAAQHPRTQEMLRLTDGGGGRQSAERPGEEAEIADCSLSLPTLPLGLKRVAWAQAPQSLTRGEKQSPGEAIPVAAAEASALWYRTGRARGRSGVTWGPGYSLSFLPSCLQPSVSSGWRLKADATPTKGNISEPRMSVPKYGHRHLGRVGPDQPTSLGSLHRVTPYLHSARQPFQVERPLLMSVFVCWGCPNKIPLTGN